MTAVEIVSYFDSKESDDSNSRLLMSELNHFRSHLIKMAFHGECKAFITSETLQKVFSILWTNAIVFTPNQIVYYKEFTFLRVNNTNIRILLLYT